jgi:release factor glutamine methyltransferase
METSAPDAASVAAMLDEVGIPTLVLRSGFTSADTAPGYRPIQILVPRPQLEAAIKVLESLSWRYSWVRTGLLHLLPAAIYWWDGARVIELYWSVPATPLPPVALSNLTRAMWRSAARTPQGDLRPDPAALLVHLAVQACRPGRGHESDWSDFKTTRPSVDDWGRVHTIARTAGVSRALRRALAAAEAGRGRPGPGPIYDGPLDVVWRLAAVVQARVRPRRLRRLLAGSPAYGDTPIRCRIAGVEVLAGAGVFVPAPGAELLVEAAIERIRTIARPTIIEVGTGCGVIALALASARANSEVHATDVSAAALRWARRNAQRLGLDRVRFYGGSLLDEVPDKVRGRVDLVIANLPYVPPRDRVAIGSLPRGTIQGVGDDGLDLQRQLARDAIPFLRAGGRLQLQMLAWQWNRLSSELTEIGYRPATPGLSGAFAICVADLVGA